MTALHIENCTDQDRVFRVYTGCLMIDDLHKHRRPCIMTEVASHGCTTGKDFSQVRSPCRGQPDWER